MTSSMDQWEEGIPLEIPMGGHKRRKRVVRSCITCKNSRDGEPSSLHYFMRFIRKHFGMGYDATQESGWHWLTNEHIRNFSMHLPTPEMIRLVCVSPCAKATGLRCFYGCWKSMCTYCLKLHVQMIEMDSWFWDMSCYY